MRCFICNHEGANVAGVHPNCFTRAINQKVGTSSRTVFSGSGIRHEDTSGPKTEQDWLRHKADAEAAKELQEEAQAQKREEARRNVAAEENERRQRAYRQQQDWFSRHQTPPKQPNALKSVSVQIDDKRLKQLLMLCHPDKHGNSERATDVTRWLIGIKEQMP